MMRYLVVSSILLIGLGACSKHTEPLNCDSHSVKSTLLNETNPSALVYYSKRLINARMLQKTDKSLSCEALLSIQSNLDNKLVLSIPVNYEVYAVDTQSQVSTSELKLTTDNQAKLAAWIVTMNNLSKQLGDYQLTPLGAVYVMKESEQQILYFNGLPVVPEISNTVIRIEQTYTLNNNPVFLLGSYTGGTIDSDTRNNLFIEIESQGKYKLTRQFAYGQNGITQTNESLVINAIAPGRPYAESTDFPIYVYADGILSIKQDVKPESYYMAKFRTWKSEDIVNQARADQCFDIKNNVLDTSHACRYAMKYCFEFKAIQNPEDNEYTKILKKACN